jgi:hypothetical protein
VQLLGAGGRAGQDEGGDAYYLTESVYNVVWKSQFPLKSVNLFFMLVITKDKLTDLWGH